jgi:excinuclease ABC subunit C
MTSQDYAKLNMPDAPGVYFFKKNAKNGSAADILYIGRATSLRDRVRSYFGDDLIHTRGPLLIDMVTQADTVEWQETGSVLEAIILESNLIKKHQPYFNTKEKDNRSFNYVVVTDEEFPRVLMVRGRNLEKSLEKKSVGDDVLPYEVRNVFGPYTSSSTLREALKIIRKIFPYRDTCVPNSTKPCFNRQIGLCPGVCTGEISASDYMKTVRRIELFLGGKTATLIAGLERDMNAYAKNQEFEKAGEVKKILYAISHIRDIALIKNDIGGGPGSAVGGIAGARYRIEAYDIAHLGGASVVGVMTVVTNGETDKAEYRKFKIRGPKGNDDVNNLKEILSRRFERTEWTQPDLIVIDGGIGQLQAARGILAGFELKIPIVSVVKDERHAPKQILQDVDAVPLDISIQKAILLANSEAHRFAIAYHKKLRKNAFLKKLSSK